MAAAGPHALLTEVPSEVAAEYYSALISDLGHGVEVRLDAGGGRGKGLFAVKGFQAEDVIFTERPLAGVQQMDSKVEVSTCSHCFRAVGTVEEHIGGKICCLINELSEVTGENDLQQVQDRVDKIHAAVDSHHLEGLLSGRIKLPLTDKVDMVPPVSCRAGCGEEFCSSGCEAKAWESYHCMLCTAAAATDNTAAASTGTSSSSGTNTSTCCPDKGKAPAAAQKQQQQHSCRGGHAAGGSSSVASSSRKAKAVLRQVHGATVNTAALVEFYHHADETNDIFRVAAQVIAQTIITADKLLKQQAVAAAEDEEAQAAYNVAVTAAKQPGTTQPVSAPKQQQQQQELAEDQEARMAYDMAAAAAAGTRTAACVLLPGDSQSKQEQQQQRVQDVQVPTQPPQTSCSLDASSTSSSSQQYLSALQAAFLPYALGQKAVWWEIPLLDQGTSGCDTDAAAAGSAAAAAAGSAAAAAAAGSDSDCDDVDAAELSAQMRELAAESLTLLSKAIRDDRFTQLFDLELFGSLIGMFELNNLALTVPAPVARYKHLLLHPGECGVDGGDAAAALATVTPLLEALGDEADQPAEGTGFFSLQSCINHSCQPNAAAECLPNGLMMVKALRNIPQGAEVLLSYIEEADASLDERQQMLLDYGFVCRCDRCTADELDQRLQAHTLEEV